MLRRAIPIALVTLLACAPSPRPVGDPAPKGTVVKLPPPEIPPAEVVPIEKCGDTADGFEDWMASYRERAVAEGLPAELARRALQDLRYDEEVIRLDRTQSHLKRSFEEFSASHVTPARVSRGKQLLETHAALFARIATRFGVAKEVIVALWGLETDFGKNQGRTRSLQALATLAYDCRRAERFRGELAAALRLLQRGDLSVDAMVGAWAGELGQTQFLPSSYEKLGIDFDGDGKIDLLRSTEDALGSTANYLAKHGWRAGEGYAAGSPNFAVLAEWNKSEIYRQTIVLFATKLSKR